MMCKHTKKNSQLSITIITLTYRDFSRIENTIKSVFEQDFAHAKNVEYIVADDGSDNFKKEFLISKIFSYQSSNKKIDKVSVYSNQENVGTVKSFNKAISFSSGDIIIPLSSGDEFYDRTSVSKIIKAFESSDSPIISAYREISNNGVRQAIRPARRYAKLLENGDPEKVLKALVLNGNFISGACTYYRAKFLHEIGGFDENYVLLEDYPLYLETLSKHHQIGFIDQVTMKHQVGGVSGRHKKVHPILEKDFIEVKRWITNNISMTKQERRYFDFFQGKGKKEKLSLKSILKHFDCFIVWLGLNVYDRVVDNFRV